MVIDLDDAMLARFREFSKKHCRGKEPRFDLLLDMCRALGLRLGVEAVMSEGTRD